jgi:hypothetical protein
MERLLPLQQQMDRRITRLGAAFVQMSLMSLSLPGLSQRVLIPAVVAAALASDIVGELADGSIGVFAMSFGQNVDNSREQRFQARLQAALPLARNESGPQLPSRAMFRSVTAYAAEISDAQDLVNLLFAMPAEAIRLAPPPSAHSPLWQTMHAHWLSMSESDIATIVLGGRPQ